MLVASNMFSITLLVIRMLSAQTDRYNFLLWNLFLAYVPLLLAFKFWKRLPANAWLKPVNILLLLGWFAFLPNSFYLASDLIHLNDTGEISKLFDGTMLLSFIFNGFAAGFLSVYLVHTELLRRFGRRAHLAIGAVFMACGFAVYLGRYMRWNSWDILTNPVGVLFDVSERVFNPIAHPESILTTLTYFLLLSTMYGLLWQLVRAIRAGK